VESAGNTVRLATLADVDAVSATVAAAFATDAAWSFFIGPDNPRAMASLARALLVPRIHRGTAWVTDDCTAVAMWDRRSIDGPGDDAADAALQEFRAEAGEDIWVRLEAYDTAVDAAAPSPPDWYLGVLATHPDVQGRGLATAVMRPGMQAADNEGWDCWLETSSVGNKAFYAGRGFTDAVAIDIPGGPPTWWLRRRSRSIEVAELGES
jgi:GNAT superfamily N-acetyltransferase